MKYETTNRLEVIYACHIIESQKKWLVHKDLSSCPGLLRLGVLGLYWPC